MRNQPVRPVVPGASGFATRQPPGPGRVRSLWPRPLRTAPLRSGGSLWRGLGCTSPHPAVNLFAFSRFVVPGVGLRVVWLTHQ
ncbi:hypothetical protein [Spirosoma flavus]